MASACIDQTGVSGLSQTVFYFAFGSNLNHYRLHQRIGDYQHIGIGYLPDYQLVFNKCGGDGSGKCTVVKNKGQQVWGAVCQLNSDQKEKLDYYEGVGHGYDAVYKNIIMKDQSSIETLLYQAQLDAMDDGLAPFNWYKEFVLSGAKDHDFPDDYIQMIEQVKSIGDYDIERIQLNRQIQQGDY